MNCTSLAGPEAAVASLESVSVSTTVTSHSNALLLEWMSRSGTMRSAVGRHNVASIPRTPIGDEFCTVHVPSRAALSAAYNINVQDTAATKLTRHPFSAGDPSIGVAGIDDQDGFPSSPALLAVGVHTVHALRGERELAIDNTTHGLLLHQSSDTIQQCVGR